MATSQLKREADRIMKLTLGKVKGEAIKNHFQCIKAREGENGVELVRKKLKEIGYPIGPKKLRPLEWFPAGLADIIVLTAKDVFNWTSDDIFKMGNSAPKYSFIMRLLMKSFINLKSVFKEAPKYWREHFTSGKLEAYEFNEKKKYLIIRLKHWCHPVMCDFYKGYFLRVAQFVKRGKLSIEETKCVNKGDPYHEFVINWK